MDLRSGFISFHCLTRVFLTRSLKMKSWQITGNVSLLHQRLLLKAALGNPAKDNKYYGATSSVKFIINVKGWTKATNAWTNITVNGLQDRTVVCRQDKQWCGDEIYRNLTLIHQPFIAYDAYYFDVTIPNATNYLTSFSSVVYRLTAFNPDFSLFTLWFRFVFLFVTFIYIVVFTIKMRGFDWKDWTIEQKWCGVLLFALLGYNNPFYATIILAQNAFPVFLDQLLLASFLVLLMLFWLVMFDGIRTEPQNQTFRNFYLPKYAVLGVFWILAIIVFTWMEVNDIYSPEKTLSSSGGFTFFFILMLALLVVYAFWLFYVIFRTIGARDSMPYLSLRLKFFGVFTLVVIAIVVIGVLAGAVGPVENNAASLLSFLSLFNLYIYICTFVYFPSRDLSVPATKANVGMVKLEELEEDDTLDASAVASRAANFAATPSHATPSYVTPHSVTPTPHAVAPTPHVPAGPVVLNEPAGSQYNPNIGYNPQAAVYNPNAGYTGQAAPHQMVPPPNSNAVRLNFGDDDVPVRLEHSDDDDIQ